MMILLLLAIPYQRYKTDDGSFYEVHPPIETQSAVACHLTNTSLPDAILKVLA